MKKHDQCDIVKNQINRIVGQIEGVRKMIAETRDPIEIVTQIQAARAALGRLAVEVLKEESQECLGLKTKKEKLENFEKLVSNFFKVN